MATTFTYKFEELPLVVAPGIEGALIDGRAEITYSGGSWSIDGIEVQAHRRLTQAQYARGESPWTYLPASEALAAIIHGRLTNEWRARVQRWLTDQPKNNDQVAAWDHQRDLRKHEVAR